MKSFSCVLSATLASLVLAAPPAHSISERATTPKLYLAGDSTMALGGGGTGTQGPSPSITIPPVPPTSNNLLIPLRLGRLPSLFPNRPNRHQRCRGRALRTQLHQRGPLHRHRQRSRIRRLCNHRIRAQ